ncbi:MAG: diacylglycerol kinase family protein [Patescibacteria group bacterium]|nr:diacylglycerol kinase family protein [Patescibacteria group bacterium]MCL5095114.1 diacylglycerol kinase family protein [Patescibacteria group bacterium]
MVETLKRHHISFKNAFAGLSYALTSQPNFKIHVFLATAAILSGFFLGISFIEMTILVLVTFIGLATEMMNTAIESVTDLVTTEWRESAKTAKDVAAGMMLLTAIGATIIALLILGPKILERLPWLSF